MKKLFLIGVLFFLSVPCAKADTATVNVDSTVLIYTGQTGAYGQIASGDNCFVLGSGYNGSEYRCLIQYTVPAGVTGTINSVTLHAKVNTQFGVNNTSSIHKNTGLINIASTYWGNAPSYGSALQSLGNNPAGGLFEWSLNTDIVAETSYSYTLLQNSNTTGDGYGIYGHNNTTYRPYVVIDYTPGTTEGTTSNQFLTGSTTPATDSQNLHYIVGVGTILLVFGIVDLFRRTTAGLTK